MDMKVKIKYKVLIKWARSWAVISENGLSITFVCTFRANRRYGILRVVPSGGPYSFWDRKGSVSDEKSKNDEHPKNFDVDHQGSSFGDLRNFQKFLNQ